MLTATIEGKMLTLRASRDFRRELIELVRRGANEGRIMMEIGEALHEEWEFIAPEDIGALTDSPILAESKDVERHEEYGFIIDVGRVAWYPGYAMACPWTELVKTGKVEFNIAGGA
jgi:hypothetical protein